MAKKHAKLSASGAEKWLNCPGSVEAESKYPNKSSGYADEGTLAHEISDLCLKNKKEAVYYLGKTLKELDIEIASIRPTHKIQDDMCQHVQEYVDYVLSFETEDSILFTEQKVDFSHIVPEGFGTCDAAILIPSKRELNIFDLKYGKGVQVDAFENKQAQMYASGFYNEIGFLDEFDIITVHICQPRLNNFSEWTINISELKTFEKYAEHQAKLALSKNAERIPGDKQCQWCAAKHECKALMQFTEKVISSQFDDLDFEDNQTMTDKDKRLILDNKDLIIAFINAVELDIYKRILDGETFEGYKLVEGRSIRTFSDKVRFAYDSVTKEQDFLIINIEDKEIKIHKDNCLTEIDDEEGNIVAFLVSAEQLLVALLEEKAYNKKLIGIGDAEKLAGKKIVNHITVKPQGKLTVVKESDKRNAIILSDVTNDFENIEEGEE